MHHYFDHRALDDATVGLIISRLYARRLALGTALRGMSLGWQLPWQTW